MHVPLAVATCHEAAVTVLTWLGTGLLVGTVLAGATWLLMRMAGRWIPHALETFLWSIVLVKFMLPVGPAFALQLEGMAGSPAAPQAVRAAAQPFPNDSMTPAPLPPLPITAPVPAVHDYVVDTMPTHPLRHGLTLAGLIYILCAAVLLGKRIYTYRAFLKRCASLPPAGRDVQHVARDVCRRLGQRRTPLVRVSGDAPSSFVTGLFRPMIIIAHNQLVRRDELETVMLHEVAHLRRSDMIVRYLQWIAGSLFFFWPVVAWVNRRLDLSRECACDQWALTQGSLSAGQYARCLFSAMQPERTGCLATHSTCLASNQGNMERRIDMILRYNVSSPKRKRWSLLAVAVMLLWGGIAFTGAVAEPTKPQPDNIKWALTEDGVREHAIQIYNLVARIGTADSDGDGVLTYVEKDAYLIALAMRKPDAFMEEFPFADRNSSGNLDYLEVYGVIRGITLIAYADRRPNAVTEVALNMKFYHLALNAQKWLLDNVNARPAAAELDNIWSIVKRIEGPRKADHRCKLDHGGPPEPAYRCKGMHDSRPRFNELENNIREVKARMSVETDPREAAKLKFMLRKLEALLSTLEAE